METVLLIESDPANLIAQALILRSFGYTVLEAGSRDEAIRACHDYPVPIHVVVTRAVLDTDDSKEVVARLQLLQPQLRALFVSDASPGAMADKQPVPNECALLQKPIRADAFANAIRELLGGSETGVVASVW